jgi:hypothetical protein
MKASTEEVSSPSGSACYCTVEGDIHQMNEIPCKLYNKHAENQIF